MAHDHDGWRSLGFRGLPPMSGRVNQPVEGGFAPLILARVEGQHASFVGITNDGVVRADLRSLDSPPAVSKLSVPVRISRTMTNWPGL